MDWTVALSVLLLLSIAFFDFKDRTIPVVLLIFQTAFIVFVSFFYKPDHFLGYRFLTNMLVLVFQLALMMVWLKWRKKGVSFFKDAFGWGDVWILAIAAFYFEPYNYVWFLVVSAVISLIYGVVVRTIRADKNPPLIPLAGIVALLLAINQVFLIF